MKIMKYELVLAIDRVRSVVTKNPQFPALEGILVRDRYLTASNAELTVQVNIENETGTPFILPMKAFDLIKNLPEGEVELLPNEAGNSVTIKMDKIKNTYQTYPAEQFAFYKGDAPETEGVTLPGKEIMEMFGHVLFAAADKATNQMMGGILLEWTGGRLNVVALDGHVLAWDSMSTAESVNMSIIIPKSAIRKILSMGMLDDITVTCDKSSAIFRSKDYTIYSRLIDGEYFKYNKMFVSADNYTITEKKTLVDAITRAKMCVDDNVPTVFDLQGDELHLSAAYSTTSYAETVKMQSEIITPLRIGFNPKLVLESVKAFTCEDITLNFINPKSPMIIEASDSDMKVLVLPVAIRDNNQGASAQTAK